MHCSAPCSICEPVGSNVVVGPIGQPGPVIIEGPMTVEPPLAVEPMMPGLPGSTLPPVEGPMLEPLPPDPSPLPPPTLIPPLPPGRGRDLAPGPAARSAPTGRAGGVGGSRGEDSARVVSG